MKRFVLLALIPFFAILNMNQHAMAAPFYEGKVLRIIVGHEVGGGYDRITRLREAFSQAAQDPALQVDAKKLMMPVNYIPADEALKVMKYVMNQPDDVVKEFGKYVKF